MDKTVLSVVPLKAPNDDGAFWRSKTPLERLEAVETMRRILYGYDPTERLQRLLEVAELEQR
jgi:hypothetical protein